MAGLAYEKNTDLAFDTGALRQYGNEYANIAKELRTIANNLDKCLSDLKENGWTTPAGTAFYKMTETNWKKNIEKYAALLDTLKSILDDAASQYDRLVEDHIEQTRLDS